jgi:hypothetical protein
MVAANFWGLGNGRVDRGRKSFSRRGLRAVEKNPHPQNQIIDDEMRKKLGADATEVALSLEEKGLIYRFGGATGVVRITQAGMNKAKELFGSD